MEIVFIELPYIDVVYLIKLRLPVALNCRLLQKQPESGHQDFEGRHHGARGLPTGGQSDEAAQARQTGETIRRRHQRAHPDRHRVHG